MLDIIIMGLTVAAIGIAVVFAILLILVFVIELISKAINSAQKKDKPMVAAEEIIEYEINPQEDTPKANNNAIIVAITAAIYAVISSEGGSGVVPEFEIRKIRQIKR